MKAMENNEVHDIEAYIGQFPPDVQEKLTAIRRVIQEAVPDATEKISYQMPTFELHGNLVHYAAYKNHIGYYPAPRGIEAFAEELAQYKGAKGSVQFPLDLPIPYDLIRRIAIFRAAENREKAAMKKAKRR
jgi:uncharacterized protein YdhG (YjbR/CyaY superfamily)